VIVSSFVGWLIYWFGIVRLNILVTSCPVGFVCTFGFVMVSTVWQDEGESPHWHLAPTSDWVSVWQVAFSTMSSTALVPYICYTHPNGFRSHLPHILVRTFWTLEKPAGAWTISPCKFQGWTCQRIARQCSVSGSFGRVTKLVVRSDTVSLSIIHIIWHRCSGIFIMWRCNILISSIFICSI
jgi:hypothetical protein